MTPGWHERGRVRALVRPYVVTGGRAHPSGKVLDHATLIRVVRSGDDRLGPEQRRLMALCQGGQLSVAEVAAYLVLPLTVTKVLLSDLIDSGHIVADESMALTQAQRPDPQLLEEVLRGLRALL